MYWGTPLVKGQGHFIQIYKGASVSSKNTLTLESFTDTKSMCVDARDKEQGDRRLSGSEPLYQIIYLYNPSSCTYI